MPSTTTREMPLFIKKEEYTNLGGLTHIKKI